MTHSTDVIDHHASHLPTPAVLTQPVKLITYAGKENLFFEVGVSCQRVCLLTAWLYHMLLSFLSTPLSGVSGSQQQ